jgi:hypothetical protein
VPFASRWATGTEEHSGSAVACVWDCLPANRARSTRFKGRVRLSHFTKVAAQPLQVLVGGTAPAMADPRADPCRFRPTSPFGRGPMPPVVPRFTNPFEGPSTNEYVGAELLVPEELNIDPDYRYVPNGRSDSTTDTARAAAETCCQQACRQAGVDFSSINPALDCQDTCRRILSELTREKANLQQQLIANEDATKIQRVSEINNCLEHYFGGPRSKTLWEKSSGTMEDGNSWYTKKKKSERTADKSNATASLGVAPAGIEQLAEHERRKKAIEINHTLEHRAPFVGAIFKSEERQWKVTGFICTGSFGDAWRARDLTQHDAREVCREVCIKTSRTRTEHENSAANAKADFDLSLKLLRTLCANGGDPAICNIQHVTAPGHPGRVTVIDRYPDGFELQRVHGLCHFIVMDLCKCELFQYMNDVWHKKKGFVGERFAERFARPLLRSTLALHQRSPIL